MVCPQGNKRRPTEGCVRSKNSKTVNPNQAILTTYPRPNNPIKKMKISELVNELEKAEREHGDVECLVEVILDEVIFDDCVALMPVEEVSFEDRKGHGESVSLLC